jgi:hypothetical protein
VYQDELTDVATDAGIDRHPVDKDRALTPGITGINHRRRVRTLRWIVNARRASTVPCHRLRYWRIDGRWPSEPFAVEVRGRSRTLRRIGTAAALGPFKEKAPADQRPGKQTLETAELGHVHTSPAIWPYRRDRVRF